MQLRFKAAKIPTAEWASHWENAETVASDLSFHTLAIMRAGAYIARGHRSMQTLPHKFRQQHAKLLQFSPKQAKSRYSHIFTIFEASASVLEERTSLEAKDAYAYLNSLL